LADPLADLSRIETWPKLVAFKPLIDMDYFAKLAKLGRSAGRSSY
jgi:hypothetical protein